MTLELETNYYNLDPEDVGTRLDNYTDAMYLNEALVGKEPNLIHNALSGNNYIYVGDEDLPPVENLSRIIASPENANLLSKHLLLSAQMNDQWGD